VQIEGHCDLPFPIAERFDWLADKQLWQMQGSIYLP